MCEKHKKPFCQTTIPGTVCAAPIPRDTNNYYNRHHFKDEPVLTCGGCYCPEGCKCPNKSDMHGRYIESPCCKNSPYRNSNRSDEEFDRRRSSSYNGRAGGNGRRSGSGNRGGGSAFRTEGRGNSPNRGNGAPSSGGKCCKCGGNVEPPRNGGCYNRAPPNESYGQNNCCGSSEKEEEDTCPDCCPPYKPAGRRTICYPPIKCCETNESGSAPEERICYSPKQQKTPPKYCTCGMPNPCECNLQIRKRSAQCENAPLCRRCGRKVYAAEKIVAANGAFHSSCFSCYCCHKSLEVTNVYENQGEIYCKNCYTKYFGVAGYGYGTKLPDQCKCRQCVNN